MTEIRHLDLPGLAEVRPSVHRDDRGRFVKPFHAPTFAANGLTTDFAEQFYSVSRQHVLRGLHFQRPPHDHAKLVYCTMGEVLDAAVDLRVGSPTYGRHVLIILSAERGNALYLPRGFAHGFLTMSDWATVVYSVETPHAPEADAGLRWDGAGIPWPCAEPLLSDRDRTHPGIDDFKSPFVYRGAAGEAV